MTWGPAVGIVACIAWMCAGCASNDRRGDASVATSGSGATAGAGEAGTQAGRPAATADAGVGLGVAGASGGAGSMSMHDPGTDAGDLPDARAPDDASVVTEPADGEISRSGTRLRRLVDRAEGGAIAVWGMHDRELDTNCEFRWSIDGRYRCLPTEAFGAQYANADCTQPLFYVPDYATCARPAYVAITEDLDGCAQELRWKA